MEVDAHDVYYAHGIVARAAAANGMLNAWWKRNVLVFFFYSVFSHLVRSHSSSEARRLRCAKKKKLDEVKKLVIHFTERSARD
jgi:hypothetical protein